MTFCANCDTIVIASQVAALDHRGGAGARSHSRGALDDSDYFKLVEEVARLSPVDFVALFQGVLYRRQVERPIIAKA